MKKYTVTFSNYNDLRTVISGVDYKTAIAIYADTKNHRRFFQDGLSAKEKNTGIVLLTRDADDSIIYECACRKVRCPRSR